jgi:hypothetical protein
LVGLQALDRRDPGKPGIAGLLRGLTPIQESVAIDNAQKPAALVRFTFLDSLRKLVGTTGNATTPQAQP